MRKTSRSLLLGAALLTTLAVHAEEARYPPYLTAPQLQLADYLPPPPAADSPRARADLAAVLNAQARRSPEQVKQVQHDNEWDDAVFHFAGDIFGTSFDAKRLPLTRTFFRRTQEDLVQVLIPAKRHYARPRPYEQDAAVIPVLPPPDGESYPSSYAMNGYLDATLLAMAVPEKRTELFARAKALAISRVIAGVHYPSDLEGGQIAAAALAARLLADPQAAADFAAVRKEIRAALNLARS